ncbi:LysR family transcriptional regulator [Morganella morganii]|uniref:LysR family transcriptional regulator n=1 Tax=Morganella morganii TaxID=582 RepID=UPI00046912AE|nr:LysR family transcriptional regulator [Morganella morganii]
MQISRSAAGKRLQRPENRASTRLLHRTTRRLRLTEEGERFFLHAKRILSGVDDAENALYDDFPVHCGLLSPWSLAAIM